MLLKCECGRYSLSEVCTCGKKPRNSHPPGFSIIDKYAEYRRKAKRAQ